jgi:hexulose-6-phosphate isomerase
MAPFDRRGFLAAAGASLALPFHREREAARVPERPSVKPRKLRKACMFGMVEGGASVREKFARLREAGFEGVELDSPSGLDLDEVRAAMLATGMEVAGTVDSVHWSKTLSDPDPAVRAQGVAALETALRDANKLGATSVVLVPAVVNAKVSYADAWTRSTAEIRKVLPLATELGVCVSVENVWNHFLLSPLEAARYVDQFESPFVGWHMDVGNIVNYGWPEQWIAVLGKRIRRLHIKDYSRKKRDEQGLWKGFDVELGDGDVGWPATMAALDAVGYEGWASAEVGGGGLERLRDVARRMDALFTE